MDLEEILAAINTEIEKLQQARDLLREVKSSKTSVKPKSAQRAKAPGKRVLSPEARKRIAAAQRKRWAVAKESGTKGGGTGDGGYGIRARDGK